MCHGNANSEIAKLRYVSEKSVEQMLARTAIALGVNYDRKQNQRVRLTNTVYQVVNGEK
jgi:DNA-binding NarL/FixJ family response regulator